MGVRTGVDSRRKGYDRKGRERCHYKVSSMRERRERSLRGSQEVVWVRERNEKHEKRS